MSAAIAMLAFALLFVCWGVLRPADQREAGCHSCGHSDDPSACGESCPLIEEMLSTSKVGVER